MVLILFGLFGANVGGGLRGLLLLVAAILSLVATYWALGPSLDFRVPYWVEANWPTILALLIIVIVIFMVVGGSGGGNDRLNRTHEAINKLFGVE